MGSDIAQDADPIIEIRDVAFKRGHREIFTGVDIDIHRGKITAIMGPSGCGKTTLLKLIGGTLKPASGTIKVAGVDVTAASRAELMRLRREMGMLFQAGALLTDLSVFENVAFPLREHTNLDEQLIHDLVLMKLEAVGLRAARSLMPSELSGGMGRRVALARAIALDPMLIMYDEPFTGQDPISMGVLVRLIKELNDALGMTSVMVSHDVAEAASIADYIYVLSRGEVVGQGSPQALRETDSEWVRQFMQGLPDGPVPFHYPGRTLKQELRVAEHD